MEKVLSEVAQRFPGSGQVYLDGLPAGGQVTVAESGLRDGAVLSFGAPLPGRHSPSTRQMVLRVVSGPSAGAEVVVPPDRQVTIGRDPACDLVLADRDVTRRHALAVAHGPAVRMLDLDSANGLLLAGKRVADVVLAAGQEIQAGGSRIELVWQASRVILPVRSQDGTSLVNRQPRNPPTWNPSSFAFPTRPKPEEKRGLNLLTLALPVVLAVVLAFVMRQWYYLMIAFISPLTYLGNNWNDRRRQKREEQRHQAEYGEQLLALRRDVEGAVDAQDAYLRALWPDVQTVTRAATTPTVELWRRRPGDPDWLNLRLGTADLPAAITFTQTRPAEWQDATVARAPIGVSLEAVRALGIAGSPDAVADTARWILLQAATLHSPTELRIAVIAPGAKDADFGWLRWLPHLSTSDGIPFAAWTEQQVEPLTKSLRDLTVQRKTEFTHDRQTILPRYLVLLAGSGELFRRPAVAELMAEGPAVGVFFICTDSDPKLLPYLCGAVAEFGTTNQLTVEGGYDRQPVTPDRVQAKLADDAARALAPLRVSGGAVTTGLPDQLRFSDLAGLPTAEAIQATWRLNPGNTRAVVGHDGETAFAVDIVRDGPHSLIAGTTRAGKSELLQTLLTSLSLNNSPADLNFLFVDYKGGPTFRDLRHLPHVTATLTNLDEGQAERALDSLRAELIRRQRQLADADATDLPEYRRKRDADASLPPFPRLIIVVDEFAELKQFLPGAMDELVGVARTGASLGVHLLLATQRPQGAVSPEIQANTSLRICLRVTDGDASRDIIDIPDAAQIPASCPGRAYVKAAGRRPVLMQTAQITTPNEQGEALVEVSAVRWNESVLRSARRETNLGQTDLQVVIAAMRDAAARDGLAVTYPVVLPPLPEILPLADLLSLQTLSGVPDLLLGFRDLPMRQRQQILTVPLGSGHLGIVGSSRSGRSSGLRAIAVALAEKFRPDQVQVYVLDGGAALAGLSALPHTGVYCRADNEELTDRLISRLDTELSVRRELLAHYGAASISELAASVRPAHLVLLVDGYEAFVTERQGPVRSDLLELFGQGLGAGLTIVMAGEEAMLHRMLSRFAYRAALSLNNTDGVAGTFRLQQRDFPKSLPPGRAIWGEDGSQFQIPLLDKQPDGISQNQALASIAARLQQTYPPSPTFYGKLRLEPLPAKITYGNAMELRQPGKPGEILLGVGGDVLACQWVSLAEHGKLAIVGTARSGRTTAAITIGRSLAANGGSVLLTGARLTQVHRDAATYGIKVLSTAEAAEIAAGYFDLVIVDDADQVTDETWLGSLAAAGQALVFVTGWDAPLGSKPVPALVRTAGVQVVLRPERTAQRAQNNLGIAVAPGIRFGGPAGRACVLIRGEAQLVQVPYSS
jgi:S-DNA-T family DNA segregation ATPase FtsK/SpoIIIE